MSILIDINNLADPRYRPIIVRDMVFILRGLLDKYRSLSETDPFSETLSKIIDSIKILRRQDPKLFYKAKPYLHAKRNKLLSAILRFKGQK